MIVVPALDDDDGWVVKLCDGSSTTAESSAECTLPVAGGKFKMSLENLNEIDDKILHDPIRCVMAFEDKTIDEKSFVPDPHSRVEVRSLTSSWKNTKIFNLLTFVN